MRISALHRHRTRRALRPLVTLTLAATVLAGLTGCGGDDGDDEPAAAPTTTAAAPPSAAPSITPTPSAAASPTRSPRPTEGDGDGEGDGEPAAAGGGICADLSEDEVGSVLGGTVTGAAIPGGGCAFTQQSPLPPAANVIELPFDEVADGMDGAKETAISTVEGDPEDLTGIGEAAFVVTGTTFGGTDVQGAGAVRVGNRLITVNLAQSAGLPRPKVRGLVVALLRLAVSETA